MECWMFGYVCYYKVQPQVWAQDPSLEKEWKLEPKGSVQEIQIFCELNNTADG